MVLEASPGKAHPTAVFKTCAPEGPFRDEIVVEDLSMNGVNYLGTITPSEARRTIFEEALGMDQVNLARINIVFNRGHIVTFKLKLQIDIDELWAREFFEFERKMGLDVVIMECRVRGVRNPAHRRAATSRAATTSVHHPPARDDGTRMVKIIGCKYKLSESKILGWLSCFGEVLTEITEERFGGDDPDLDPSLPSIGNGTYTVKMRLVKDMPNWMPMFGRKVFFLCFCA